MRADLLKSARQKLLVNTRKHKLLVEAWTRWSNKGWEAFRRPWFESHSTTHSAKKRCSNPNEKEIVGNQPLAKLSQSKVEDEKHFYFSCLFCWKISLRWKSEEWVFEAKDDFFANADDDEAVTRTLSIFISIFEVEKKLTASFITQKVFVLKDVKLWRRMNEDCFFTFNLKLVLRILRFLQRRNFLIHLANYFAFVLLSLTVPFNSFLLSPVKPYFEG